MNTPLAYFEFFLQLLVAVACGGVLGWERESQNKPAGLRTHMLVALGAAVFTAVTLQMHVAFGVEASAALDPARAVQGIIGGIGFLGAGTIIQSRGSVRGITTAATIWVVGAIGIACGARQYDFAIITTLVAVLVLAVLGRLERYPLAQQESRTQASKTNDG